MTALVSAIIPTHNRSDVLRRAIRSVEEQTYEPIELIVVGSPDTGEVRNVVRSADVAGSEFVDAGATSPAAARNIGIARADGKWLAFLDDDDEWLPEKIKRQLDRLSESGSGACHTGIRKLGPEGSIRAVSRPTAEGDVTKELLTRGPYGSLSAMMVRRQIARSIGGFDEDLKLYEDTDFNIRVSQRTNYCTVQDDLVIKHADETIQVTDDISRMASDGEYLIKKHRQLALSYGSRTLRQMIVKVKHGVGRAAANQGMYSTARETFLLTLREDPTHYPSLFWLLLVAGGSVSFRTAQSTKRRVLQVLNTFN